MNIDDEIRLNRWSQEKFHDPRGILLKLREVEVAVAARNLNPDVRRLRKPSQRRFFKDGKLPFSVMDSGLACSTQGWSTRCWRAKTLIA